MSAHGGVARMSRLLSTAALPMFLAGCGFGTVIVDYAVDAEVTIHDMDGRVQRAGSVATVPRPADLASPFDAVKYRGGSFDWTFGTNLHPQPRPLQIYSWSAFRGQWTVLGSTDPRRRRDITPPSLCVKPGEEVRISFTPDLAAMFPTQ
jgi:hypothetical protein